MSLPRIQAGPIDVAGWEPDPEFAVFPQGAREKTAVFAPPRCPHAVVRPGTRYLFKRSKKSYPDQFWGEIVAYRIGCLLDVQVPPAFAAYDSTTGTSAALIEWFYEDGEERFVHAGDYLQQAQPDFDRELGTDHSLRGTELVLRVFDTMGLLKGNWREWWSEALVFDALIGNTDRHQDNWGFIWPSIGGAAYLAPLFDNGTSLGHERFTERVQAWNTDTLNRYVDRGCHHVRWQRGDEIQDRGHFKLVRRALERWPDAHERIRAITRGISEIDLRRSIADLPLLTLPLPLTEDRAEFMLRLLSRRLQLLQEIL